MGIGFLQSLGVNNNPNANSNAISVSGTVSADSLLIVGAGGFQGTFGNTGINDTRSNTWTNRIENLVADDLVALFWAYNPTAGAITISLGGGSVTSQFHSFGALEFSLSGGTPSNGAFATNDGNSANPSAGAVLPIQADNLILGVAGHHNTANPAMSAVAPAIQGNQYADYNTSAVFNLIYRIQTAATSSNAQHLFGSISAWVAAGMAVNVSAASVIVTAWLNQFPDQIKSSHFKRMVPY